MTPTQTITAYALLAIVISVALTFTLGIVAIIPAIVVSFASMFLAVANIRKSI